MSEILDEDEPRPLARLCGCGCLETEHDGSGRCLFCGPDDCSGFTYDPEATLLMDIFPDDV